MRSRRRRRPFDRERPEGQIGLTTDDGFIIESNSGADEAVDRCIVFAIDEGEARDLLAHDVPEAELTIINCGDDVRAQEARLGVEPETYRLI
ncbi:hypothetical protein GCM10008171_17320 [Methylopila jiangsuensis]|uniref:Uncharacterized protein n=1 Tax=Methylopila jiangsuensis TaxID=586230 RepID=A0A9W6JJ44_9HYPH|nr:hypothetical protein GCM10008171_17320 [Methylopila jiangsuensis]